jgi:uncharacterized protein
LWAPGITVGSGSPQGTPLQSMFVFVHLELRSDKGRKPLIDIESHAEGSVLSVRAQPGSKRNELRGEWNGMLKVCVTQIAEKGKANKALVVVLSKSLGLKKSQVELITGLTSSEKRFLIRNVTPDVLREKLIPLLDRPN